MGKLSFRCCRTAAVSFAPAVTCMCILSWVTHPQTKHADFDQWVIWVALNEFSIGMSIWSGTDANYRLRNEFCLSGISCVIFRVSVAFDLLMHFHCCPQRRLALAGCDSTTWISRWREVGVWSDSYRHLLGPHFGALLQEVKHSRAPTNTPWISSVMGVCVHVRHSLLKRNLIYNNNEKELFRETIKQWLLYYVKGTGAVIAKLLNGIFIFKE